MVGKWTLHKVGLGVNMLRMKEKGVSSAVHTDHNANLESLWLCTCKVSVCSRRNQNDVASSTKKASNDLQSSFGSEDGKLWKYFQFSSANFLPYYWILLRHYMQKTLISQFHLSNYNVFPEYIIKTISEFSFSKIQVSPMYQLFIPIRFRWYNVSFCFLFWLFGGPPPSSRIIHGDSFLLINARP